MTAEDKKLIAGYMGWTYHVTDDGKWWNCIGPKGGNHLLDLNDAGLVVAEMQKRGEWDGFFYFVWNRYRKSEKLLYKEVNEATFTALLFNADNFFNAMSEWLKERWK